MKEIKILIDEKTIEKRVDELAKQIMKDYEGKEIVILSLLKGSIFFTIELTKRLKNKVYFEFIEISSYGNATTSSGKITVNKDLTSSIEGKDILVIEDLIDTGRTLSYLVDHLKEKKPNSVKIATLLSKPERREIDVKVDYVGFEIPNKFVIGYGMDYEQAYRNLPYVGYIE